MDIFDKLAKQNRNIITFNKPEDKEKIRIREYIDTEIVLLNLLLSGKVNRGFPMGKTMGMAGPSKSGKTYLSQLIARKAQKNYGYHILYIDTEGAQDLESLEQSGFDIDNNFTFAFYNKVKNVNNFLLNIIKSIYEKVDAGEDPPKIFIVLDSLGMMTTDKEYDDTTEGKKKRDMTRAQEIKAMYRTTAMDFAVTGLGMIAINHIYASVGGFGGNEVGGGQGAMLAPSVVWTFTKSQEKEGDVHVGSGVRIANEKNRFCKEKSYARVVIDYANGIDKYSGLFDFAYEQVGVFDKKGSWYYFTGDSGTEYKNQGKKFPNDVWDKMLEDGMSEKLEEFLAYSSQSLQMEESVDDVSDVENDEEIAETE